MTKATFILSAGLGTRLRPFTQVQPKPFLPLIGASIFEWVLRHLSDSTPTRVGTNIHHLPVIAKKELEHIQSTGWTSTKNHKSISIELSDETKCLLGSSGGMSAGWKKLGEPSELEVTNADVLCPIPWDEFRKAHRDLTKRHETWLTLLLMRKSPVGEKYRTIITKDGLVLEMGLVADSTPFYTGTSILNSEALQLIPANVPSDFRETVLEKLIPKQKVACVYLDDLMPEAWWLDIGSPKLWMQTHFELLNRFKTNTNSLPNAWKKLISENAKEVTNSIWASPNLDLKLSGRALGPAYFYSNEVTELRSDTDVQNVIYYFEKKSMKQSHDLKDLKEGIYYKDLFCEFTKS